MANTELITTQTVGGNQDFGPFAIEYIDITDIKVSLDGVLQTLTTEYTIDSATSTVTFVTAPDVGAVIRIFRETPVENAKAILYPGSSIRAQNVNDNTEQALFAIQEIKDQYVTESGGEFVTNVDLNDNRITNLADPTDAQDAATKAYVDDNTWDDETETIHSDEAWTSVDSQIATTASIENRIEAKIDSAITGDIGTDGTGITVTNDGDGTITLGIASNSVDFDRLKNSDIITEAEQNSGTAETDNNIFTAAAAARRFDGIVQIATPSGSNWETGKLWYQNDEDKTVYVWDGDSWEAVTSGGAFTRLDQVIYVDATNGDDANNGHRISTPKRTIRAALADINADATYGDGSTVVVAPGIYAEEFPIDIEKNDVSIVGTSLRNCIIHPAIPVADQAGYDVDVPEANELATMFRVNSGTYVANLTLMGMKASGARGGNTLDTDATYGLPTNQGWNFAFYPGATIRKSPYIQNCTNFSDSQINNVNFNPHTPGEGAAGDLDSAPSGGGILVNGATVDSASPLRSMVCDSYTHTALDGPGIFVTNNGYCQATSSYSFFNHYHLKCLNGGQANLAASTTDFGRYSLIADGRSTSAIFTATVNGAASSGSATFDIDNLSAGSEWFGSATRPQDNMLVDVGGNTYPVLSATPITGGWRVEISRPDTGDRTVNLGLNGNVANDASVSFYLRSMIASSGHTMEYVGSGTNYQALPSNGGVPDENNQIIELNDAKVWAAITDHQGTFRVGDTFEVNQQTGFVNIPAGALSVSKLLANLDTNNKTIVNNLGDVTIDDTLSMNSNRITNVSDPTSAQDAATKAYVDQLESDLEGGQLDNLYFRQDTGETIESGDTWSSSDSSIATTAAIDARIIDLVDDVGGFVPIVNETSFPASNPDVNDGAGTLISIKEIATSRTPSSGTVTIANGSGSNTVTITGCGTTVLAAGYGAIVETTSTLHTYTFHRLTPLATEVSTLASNISDINTVADNIADINTVEDNIAKITTVADDLNEATSEIDTVATNITNVNNVGNNIADVETVADNISSVNSVASDITNVNTVAGSISNVNTVATNIASVNNFSNVYRIDSSNPTTSLDVGDLVFNTTDNELRVYNGSTWQAGVTATSGLVSKSGDTMTGNLLLDNDASAASPDLGFDGDDDTGIYSPGANQFAITTGGTGRLFVDSSGRVGVGIASPGTQLEIAGSASTLLRLDSSNGNGGVIRIRNSGVDAHYFGSSADFLTGGAAGETAIRSNSAILFGISSNERARIDSSGRLLVGTSSYTSVGNGATLQVKGSSSAESSMSLVRTAAGGPEFHFAAGTSGTNIGNNNGLGFIKFLGYHTNGYDEYARIQAYVDGTNGDGDAPGRLVFSTTAGGASSPTERMRISANGNLTVDTNTFFVDAVNNRVGVGTTSPGAKCDIAGGSDAALRIYNTLNNTPSANHLELLNNSADGLKFSVGRSGAGGNSNLTYDNNFSINAGATGAVTFDSSGRLGVGTSLPGKLLEVSSSTDATIRINDPATIGAVDRYIGGVEYYTNDSSGGAKVACSIKGYHVDISGNGRLQFATGAETTAMTIDGSQRVGIGTTSPSQNLHVNGSNGTILVTGTTNTSGVSLGVREDGQDVQLINNGSGGAIRFLTNPSGGVEERGRWDSSGRFLVGTTTPGPTAGEQLTIAGSVNAGMTIRSGTTAAGSILFEDTAQDRGEIQYSHNGDYMRFKTAGTERLRFASTGAFGLSGANYGTSGQVLTSQGSGSAPQWATPSASTGNEFQIANVDVTGVSSATLTGIDPDAVKLVLTYQNVSSASSTDLYVRIGNSSGVTTSGYNYNSGFYGSSTFTSYYNSYMRLNVGFNLQSNVLYGRLILNKHSSNYWIAEHKAMSTNYTDYIMEGVGYVPAGGTLDRIQIYTSTGVNFSRGTWTLSEYRE